MPVTYNLIASNTLTTSAASVTFSAIPSTFTDLVVRASSRGSVSGNTAFYVSLNGAAGGNLYSYRSLTGEGPDAFSQGLSNFFTIETYASVNDSGTTANTFNNIEIYIPNYLSSTNKAVSIYGVKENNSSTGNSINAIAGLWRSTAAVTSVVLNPQNGNFVSGSSFFLYGIKNN